MDLLKTITKARPWKVPLIPLTSVDLNDQIPLYGPLNIQNYSQFLNNGKNRFKECFYAKCCHRVTLDDFNFIHCIAEGGFGKIILAEQKNEEKSLYAMKALGKEFVIKNNLLDNILNEKRILQSLQCPFCISLEYICQTNSHLYLFLPFISGGDVFTHLRKLGKFQENLSKFYAAQVVLAVEFLQNCDVIHRDLKPENILIDHFGFLKVADFGLAKVVTSRTYTFCGTVEYAAPEVILGKGYGKSVDWWSLGILIFEMNSGYGPFYNSKEIEVLENILMKECVMPGNFSDELKRLIRGLLEKNITKRLGNMKQGVEEIKSHPWFNGIDWLELLNRKVVPPFIPDHSTRFSKDNFPSISTVSDSNISTSEQSSLDKQFKDF